METKSPPSSSAGLRVLVGAACVVVVVAGLREASQLVLPFLVASFLAVISLPFMLWLRRLGVPQILAVLSTVLVAVAMVGLLVLTIGQSVNAFRVVVPRYQARLQELFDQTVLLAEEYGLPVAEGQSLDVLPVGVFDILGGALGAVASFASNSFLVLLTVVFILLEAAGFSRKLRRAFGKHVDLGQVTEMANQVQRYLVIKTVMSALTGIMVALWVAALGLAFPALWGVTAFLFNYIPTLGSILAAVPAVLFALVQFGPGMAALVAVGYIALNVVFGSLLEPMLLGRRLGLSTLVIFVSLVFWGWVWGPVGMLFAVPLTMVIKITLENTREFRWVALMLDANQPIRRVRTRAAAS